MGPSRLLNLEVQSFFVLLVALLGYRLLTRRIALRGLFADKMSGQQVSAERVQLFIATLAFSAKYLGQVAHSSGGSIPEVSTPWLAIFGASSGIYAGVKAGKMWL